MSKATGTSATPYELQDSEIAALGDSWRGFGAHYPDWVLILTRHFELFGFAMWSFICLLMSAVTLFLAKTPA